MRQGQEAADATQRLLPQESEELTKRWNALKPMALVRWGETLLKKAEEAEANPKTKEFVLGMLRRDISTFMRFAAGTEGADAVIKRVEALGKRLQILPISAEAPEKTSV